MLRVAIIGTVGVPANYGGFETLVENIIGENASDGVVYTIFCSSKAYHNKLETYKGAQLKYIGLKANGAQSTLYDVVSMLKTTNRYDVALILGVSGCIFLPIFRLWFRKRLIVNIDGLEHRRGKWGKFAKWFLRKSEAMAVKYADVVVADNRGIQEYVLGTYHRDSALIAYGGDHVKRSVAEDKQEEILKAYGVSKNQYAISVCRIEPENNCQLILEAFAKANMPLIYVGNWENSEYGRTLKRKYSKSAHIKIFNQEYDLDTLYTLRSNASMYIHGHSAGGTNPSLVEAMFFGKPILAYDVVYNRATTFEQAYYFKTAIELTELINKTDLDGTAMMELAHQAYTWEEIASQYEALYIDNLHE